MAISYDQLKEGELLRPPADLPEPALSVNARKVLERRYLHRIDNRVVESPGGGMWRVAEEIARGGAAWADEAAIQARAREYYGLMASLEFLPNSPTLMNAGKRNGLQYSACYVLPVEDSMEGIFDSVKRAALIHKSGGGTGFAFSRLRPTGDIVGSTGGVASGPVSFMEVFNGATESVKQGGTRRGANMGILRVDHPDILSFIDCKRVLSDGPKAAFDAVAEQLTPAARDLLLMRLRETQIANFNISVAITDRFMEAVKADGEYELVHPRSGEVVKKLRAREVFDRMTRAAWETGDPGVVFIDRINAGPANPVPEMGPVEATNPCGEQPLYPNEACNLGSVNLAKYVLPAEARRVGEADVPGVDRIDWERMERTVRSAIRFLDDVINMNPYPDRWIDRSVKANRRVGLGVMGWADMLILLEIAYDSEEALQLASETMRRINEWAHDESCNLAEERGPFPTWPQSIYRHGRPQRNSTVTTIAPTGTISIIAGCSSGIEPLFALVFDRKGSLDGQLSLEVNPYFFEVAKREGFWSEDLARRVNERGTVRGLDGVPEKWQRVFGTAHDIAPDWHVRMQAAWQKHVDNAVSKCIAAGTLIPTSRGLIRIEDFADTEEEDSFTPLDYDIAVDGHRVISHYRAGVKPATRITLDNGASLSGATESHRVMTVDGWKRLAELRPGDLIVGKYVESHGPGGAPLPQPDPFRTNANPVSLPERMTPALATFLGMLIADGHTIESTGQVGLTHKDDAVEREFVALAEEIFGMRPRVVEDRRNGVRVVYLTSRALARVIEGLIGKGAYNKVVPDAILRGSAEEKLAFLRGISLDGYVTERGLCLYGGMSEQCAYQVAEICRSFGLPKVYQGTRAVTGRGPYHYVVISGALQGLVRCIETRKNVEPLVVAHKVLVGSGVAGGATLPADHPAYSSVRAMQQQERAHCLTTTAVAAGWSTETPVYRVVKVEDAGLVDMYDIEVANSHAYVVNGMVSHNTINLPHDATVADVEHAYRLAYEAGCMGMTVYRDGSKEGVLHVGTGGAKPAAAAPAATSNEDMVPRPKAMDGVTYSVETPLGTAYITINHDESEEPREVFVNQGKAGSDIAPLSEAIGKLASIALRIPSTMPPRERLREITRRLRGIGGSSSLGFGPDRTRSLPDALAKVLDEYLERRERKEGRKGTNGTAQHGNGQANGNGAPAKSAAEVLPPLARFTGDLCPDCGMALVYEEGCSKCMSCGFARC